MHDAKLKLYTRRLNTDTEWYVWWLQLDGKTTAITLLSPITRCVIGHQRKRKLHRVAITNCYTIICSMFSSQMDSVQWLRMWERVVKCVDVMWSWSVMCQGHRLTLALCPLFCEANSPWLGCCFLSVFFAALPSGLWGVGLIELTNPSLQCCRGARHTRWGSGDVTLRESVAMQYASLEFGLLIQNWRGVNYFAVFLLFFCITVSICDFNMTEWTWIDLIRCPPVSLAVMFSWKMFNCFLIVSQCLRTRTRSWLWWSMPARASCMTTSASAAAWASGRRDTSSDR